MQTQKDILENQPWNLVEDEILDLDPATITTEEDDDINETHTAPPASTKSEVVEDDKSIFAVLAEDFTEKGIANFDPDWDGSEDEFRQKIYDDIKASVINDFNLSNPVVAGFLEYVSSGGDPGQFIQQISMSSAVSSSDEDVYFMYMKSTTNFSDDKIKRLIEKSKDLGEFEDEVAEFREEIKQAQELQIKEIAKKQAEEKKIEEARLREDAKKRREYTQAKTLLGVPVTKNKEFEKFYLQPTEVYEYEGKKYNVTGYQKRLLERQTNRAEYETFLAYLEFSDYKLPTEEKKVVAAATSQLKSKLQTYVTKGGRTTTLIDEI